MSNLTLFFDFDGVIMDSMPVRTDGFRKVLVDYPEHLVDRLVQYHLENGGLSRYHKFRYFFEELLGEDLSDDDLQNLCGRFSVIMKESLINPDLLIRETVDFIEQHHEEFPMYVVSGSDEKELNYLCKAMGIDRFFREIKGSPVPKKENLKNLIDQYKPERSIMIGDSINDFEAAQFVSIPFYGYNSDELMNKGKYYIRNFNDLYTHLMNG